MARDAEAPRMSCPMAVYDYHVRSLQLLESADHRRSFPERQQAWYIRKFGPVLETDILDAADSGVGVEGGCRDNLLC